MNHTHPITPEELLPTVLAITVHHKVTAGDASTEYDDLKRFYARELKAGDVVKSESMLFDGITIESVGDGGINLQYHGESRTLHVGDEWVAAAEVVDDSPYPSRDELTMTVAFYIRTPWMQIPEIMDRIMAVHEKSDSSVIAETARDEQRVLALIDIEIESGDVGCYPLKALLCSCNNWYTAGIVRPGQFQEILLEGIAKGALAPDDETGWSWMKTAAETNDPETFMTDMDRYYELLADAAENGNYDALDIMNTIWEPEQIIEED